MFVRREPGRGGKILSDHRQDGDDYEVHRLEVRLKKKKKPPTKRFDIFPPDWGMLRRSRRVQIFLMLLKSERT